MIFVQRGMEPEILKTKGRTQTGELCAAYELAADDYDNGKASFDFNGNIYAHKSVKEALHKMQHGKCCFCESKLKHPAHIETGDVEHYRPKAGYNQTSREKKPNKPGYYWLSYDWDNLLLCCGPCNRQHKKNLFPLLDPKHRACHHRDDIAKETALLIDPTQVDPEKHIGFREEIPYAINGNRHGKTTISVLKLDERDDLNEARREKLAHIKKLIQIIELANKQPRLIDLAKEAEQSLLQFMKPEAEYLAMVKAIDLPSIIATLQAL
jgi:uncharacterized protein (TIGR02646 family)